LVKNVDPHEHNTLRGKLFVKLLQIGGFKPTGRTPGIPKIDHENLAGVISRTEGVTEVGLPHKGHWLLAGVWGKNGEGPVTRNVI
jgi:hypothetical protein